MGHSLRRKHWFKVYDSILTEPWSDEAKLTFVHLQAHLNRLYRDGDSWDQACRAALSKSTLQAITRKSHLKAARNALRKLTEFEPISIEEEGEITRIHWPNFARLQRIDNKGRPDQGHRSPTVGSLRTPDPNTYSDSNSNSTNRAKSASEEPSLDELVGSIAGVPERLSPSDRETFGRWLSQNYAPLWNEKLALERECLAHYRKHPDRAAKVRSWLAACEGYAAKAWELRDQSRRDRGLR